LTQFGVKSAEITVADQRAVEAAVSTMLGRPVPVR
jgi:hypothetical protein